MTPEENKAVVRRFYAEIDQGNLAALDELVAEEYVNHAPPPFPELGSGREGLKQAMRLFWEATPGTHRIEDMFAEGDKVVTRLTATGRHERDLPGIPATGHALEMGGIAIHRLVNGKIVEHWSEKDTLGFLQQLGVIPLTAQDEAEGMAHA